ncbi:PiggyBac transposable element-derived protein 4 [Plakobranchus ocellatus]|uniref:PiggyBac transposable element-derived protein 4 n=1 Tax=Plakobranchus ocellatus TaxID=259542 RepID=A0AAV4BV60_9GAST|nr:PiggyBac transposable element-derived protein 4 [Plakobranchus ocellatus]
MDQMAKQFSTKRKSRRWPLVYLCNMLDLSCLAANIIFKENKPNDLLSHQNARSDFNLYSRCCWRSRRRSLAKEEPNSNTLHYVGH